MVRSNDGWVGGAVDTAKNKDVGRWGVLTADEGEEEGCAAGEAVGMGWEGDSGQALRGLPKKMPDASVRDKGDAGGVLWW